MSDSIKIHLLDGENIVINETDKKHCFFVGKPEEASNAVFEKAYEITNVNWPENVFAFYEVGSRKFSNLSFSMGEALSKAKGAYKLKKHPDGTVYLCMHLEYPVHDSYERVYACRFQRVVYKENGEVVVIQAKYGSVLPKINVFVGLKESVPNLDGLLDILDKSDSYQSTRLKLLMRCVAQKYHLSDAVSEQMENFVIYTCLDAANISASFGIFKNKKKTLSYELLKAIADYVCGNCSPEWYAIAPKRRYERLSDLIDYIRHLKRDKYLEWSAEEKAFCHTIRKYIDSSVFADVYAVSLVLLRFLAENDIRDVYAFKAAAVSPGVFSSTLMADTVDRFSAGQLDGEAKKVFFSLVGKNADNVKTRVERALYRYHAGSNSLFHTTQTLTLQSGKTDTKREAKVLDDAVETATLSAAAKAALLTRGAKEQEEVNADEELQGVIAAMCAKICDTYGVSIPLGEEEAGEPSPVSKLLRVSAHFADVQMQKLPVYSTKTYTEMVNEFLPERSFVLVYTTAYLLLRIIHLALNSPKLFEQFIQLDVAAMIADDTVFDRQLLQSIMLEAKYRYGAMCGAELLESMAHSEEE